MLLEFGSQTSISGPAVLSAVALAANCRLRTIASIRVRASIRVPDAYAGDFATVSRRQSSGIEVRRGLTVLSAWHFFAHIYYAEQAIFTTRGTKRNAECILLRAEQAIFTTRGTIRNAGKFHVSKRCVFPKISSHLAFLPALVVVLTKNCVCW